MGGARRKSAQARLLSALIFLVLIGTYLANGDILPGSDTIGSVRLAGKLVAKHSLVFTPEEEPFMFVWRLRTPKGDFSGSFRSWDSPLNGKPVRDLRARGELRVWEPTYSLVRTPRPDVYASRYGIGAALFAAPFVAATYPFVRDLYEQPSADVLWGVTKVAASCAVAATAVLIFLAALAFVRSGTALALALTYGLATCAWSSASQALWQHGPTCFFLALGTTFLLRQREQPRTAYWVGLSYAAAFACRPTAAFVLATAGIHFLVRDRRTLLRCAAGTLPVLALLAAYNLHTFGRLLVLGQMDIGVQVPPDAKVSLFNLVSTATAATGDALALDRRYFGASLLEGLAGILVSPSRGLLVFSPVVVATLWGVVRAFRDPRYAALRPVAAAALISAFFVAGWFSWWGGWSYGPRLLSDAVVLLAFLAIPVAEQIRDRVGLKVAFMACLAWSVSVQFTGAFAYDVLGWNQRRFFAVQAANDPTAVLFTDRKEAQMEGWARGAPVEERTTDVNTREGHARLWSLWDNQIFYYFIHFSDARALKRLAIEQFLRNNG